jgi:hypothetical protein
MQDFAPILAAVPRGPGLTAAAGPVICPVNDA